MRRSSWLRLAVLCLAPVALSGCSYLPSMPFGFGKSGSASTPAPAATAPTKAQIMMDKCTAAGYPSGSVAYDLCVNNGTGLK